jgi:hypothetical protein
MVIAGDGSVGPLKLLGSERRQETAGIADLDSV